MSISSHSKSKSNHMLQYYRKQSDKKMINTIIHMKSQLSDNFSLQKYQRKSSINKSKREMTQTIKKNKIHQQNKKLVYRIKQVRQKTMKDNLKYLDNTYYQRLTNTRNSCRQKVKTEQQSKIKQQNQLILKRLINTKSSYSINNSTTDLNSTHKNSSKKLLMKRSSNNSINFKQLTDAIYGHPHQTYVQQQLQPNAYKLSQLRKTSTNSNNKRAKTQTIDHDKNYNIKNIKNINTSFDIYPNEVPHSNHNTKNRQSKTIINPQKQSSFKKVPKQINQVSQRINKTLSIQTKSYKESLVKIPLKSREIKLQVINKNKKVKLTQYERSIKKSIQAKGAWGNSWLKSYRIVV